MAEDAGLEQATGDGGGGTAVAAPPAGDGAAPAEQPMVTMSQQEWDDYERERRDQIKDIRRLTKVAADHAKAEAEKRAARPPAKTEVEAPATAAARQKVGEAQASGELVMGENGSATYRGKFFQDGEIAKELAARDASLAEVRQMAEAAHKRAEAAEQRAEGLAQEREQQQRAADATHLTELSQADMDKTRDDILARVLPLVPVPDQCIAGRDRWLEFEVVEALHDLDDDGKLTEGRPTRDQFLAIAEATVNMGREHYAPILLVEQQKDNDNYRKANPAKSGRASAVPGPPAKGWPEDPAARKAYLQAAEDDVAKWVKARS